MTKTQKTSPFVDRTLDNGLRVCLEPLPHLPSAAGGFLVRTGARDETPEEEGISHFLEHMTFKGTARSTWEDINRRFDELGSKYNAFTSHEKTVFYGWVPAENLLPQIDLLAEMMRSTFPEDEFVTEKKVVLEEIAMYRDSLESCMFDLATRELFAGSPLALSVLGTKETVGLLTRDQMVDYHRRRYGPENMIFVASGALDPDQVVAHLQKVTATWERGEGGRDQVAATMKTGVAKEQIEKFKQQALMLCYPGPAAQDDDARVMVLSQILSGPNSRIFWNVLQEGICPDAGAFHLDHSDTGLLVLYGLCEPDRAEAVLAALRAEAQKITDEGPTPFEVERVKNAMRTQIARDGDAPMRRLLQVALQIELFDAPRTLEETLARVEAVTVDDIRAFLNTYPIVGDDNAMLVSVGPSDFPSK
ncbi:MAG: insulinase family protein [Deltaproteobacteria bacterium]|nr:insulinase family protein [Deltaproteobacteria bacterium]